MSNGDLLLYSIFANLAILYCNNYMAYHARKRGMEAE